MNIIGRFNGTFRKSIHSKRIILPKEFTSRMSANAKNTVVQTVGTNENIVLYPIDEWKKYIEKLKNSEEDKSDLLQVLQHFATEEKIEPNGRIKLNENLLKTFGFKKKVVIQGDTTHFSVWKPEKHVEFSEKLLGVLKDFTAKDYL